MDKLLLVPKLGWVVASTLAAALSSPLRGNDAAPTVSEHVVNTMLRTMFTNLTYSQLQAIMPSFISVYKTWCKAKNLTPAIVDIPNTPIQGFWVGDPQKATHVLVYFHGGGFVMPGVPQHLDLCHSMTKWCNENLAIFCPAYTLASGAPYPTQIGECVEALRYALSQPGRSPSNVMIGGDSAGGNLVLAILSHISGHPHSNSSLVKQLELEGKLCGALAISPWTSSDEDKFASVSQFAERDCITATCANYWKSLYKGGFANPTGQSVSDDQYIVPEIAEPQWWKGAKVESMLVTVGEEEVLRDAILSWGEKFKEGVGEGVLKVVRAKKEAHDGPLNPKTEAELNAEGAEGRCSNAAIRSWLRGLVG